MCGGTLLFAGACAADPVGKLSSGGFGPSVGGPVANGLPAAGALGARHARVCRSARQSRARRNSRSAVHSASLQAHTSGVIATC